MRTHHLLASSLVLLLAVSASAQESLIEQGEPAIAVPPIHEDPYGFYPSYASYRGLDMPSFCCGTHSPHVGHWGAGSHGRHCSACGSKHLQGGLFSQLRANRRGCPTCAATTCCDMGCCSGAVQKGGPIQKGAVQKYAAAQKCCAPQHPVVYQKSCVPPTKIAPPRVWAAQKSPVVQKASVVQKGAVQKSAWQKSTDCCTPSVSSGWRVRLPRCGRLQGIADPCDPCCTGGKVGPFSAPEHDYQPSPSDVEEDDSILIPPPPPVADPAT